MILAKRQIRWICLLLVLLCYTLPSLSYASLNHLDYTGYVEGSYNYLVKNHQFTSGINNRFNDLTQNGFTLQQAAVTVSTLPKEGFGGLLNVMVGRDANSLAPMGWNPYYGSQMLAMVVPQAYLQYASGPYTLIGGVFETLVGYENFNPTLDSNFSRSILDGYAEPGVLMGVRGFYVVTDQLKLNAGLNNGWSGFRDRGRGKTLEAGAIYQFNPALKLVLQAVTGTQRLTKHLVSGPTGRRDLVNLYGNWQVTDALMIGASGDYAGQSKALAANGDIESVWWDGISGYANYQFTDMWHGGLRGEWYNDQNGYTTGIRQTWHEITLTCGYRPRKDLELRAETRRDYSHKRAFMNTTGAGAAHYQQSLALEALYRFGV